MSPTLDFAIQGFVKLAGAMFPKVDADLSGIHSSLKKLVNRSRRQYDTCELCSYYIESVDQRYEYE